MTWAYAMPRLIQRVDAALGQTHLTYDQRADIASISERIGNQFGAIQLVVNSDESSERLIASMDRLREEIAPSETALDRILLPQT